MPMIEARLLAKHFGAVEALRGVSFECRDGEVFGLLGPNGAGKTTCLRVLSTVLKPTSGTATLGGFDLVKDAGRVRGLIGVLPANAGLYGRLTPRENLRYFGELYGMSGKPLQNRIDQLLDRLGMTEVRDRKMEGFSSGMQQKVALARAIVHDPPIIFLDEPTDGLDVPTARIVYELVEELRRSGKCIVFSTHRMEESERLCSRIGIIAGGLMRAFGTVEELHRQAGTENMEEVFIRLAGEAR